MVREQAGRSRRCPVARRPKPSLGRRRSSPRGLRVGFARIPRPSIPLGRAPHARSQALVTPAGSRVRAVLVAGQDRLAHSDGAAP
jgi:hypothetical protein